MTRYEFRMEYNEICRRSEGFEERILCSELLILNIRFDSGRERKITVNLEEIWSSAALFLTDWPVRSSSEMSISCRGHQFWGGAMAHTFCRTLAHFIELRFSRNCRRSPKKYRPKYLLNVQILAGTTPNLFARSAAGQGPFRFSSSHVAH